MKNKVFPSKTVLPAAALLWAVSTLPFNGNAATFVINNTTADAFLAQGSADNPAGTDLTANNYGGAGTLAIAPASSPNGEFDSVVLFNTAAAVSAFNTDYGVGDWTITGLTLSLASNTGTQGATPGNNIFNTVSGGSFGIDWLADDSWVEGSGTPQTPSGTGVNFDSIPTLTAGDVSLGTYTYTPPGNNMYESYLLSPNNSLVTNAAAGGNVSLYFYAADDEISYLFNSRTGPSPHPELSLTAEPTPEPAAASLMALSLGGLLWRRRKSKP